MPDTLQPGVRLSVLPTDQFKTTRISVHFMAPLDPATISARTLLTSLLETSSAEFPTQAAMSAELERMYGADFGIGVNKDGQVHRLTATLSVVADRVAGTDLLRQAFAFLQSTLLHPLLPQGQFDAATFARERENLVQYLASLAEDRQTQAGLALQALYFAADSKQAVPSFGTATAMAAVTPAQVLAAYHQIITQDQILITVLGPVDPATVRELAAGLGFAARTAAKLTVSVDRPVSELVAAKRDEAPVVQAKLNLGYHVDTDIYGPQFYAASVASALFGGSPLSLLFTNVREKASLAYYASSVLDPLRHFMMVQTGIDTATAPRVAALIAEQLRLVQTGAFSDDLLANVKQGMLTSRLTAYDSPRFLARQALLRSLVPGVPGDYDSYAQAIGAVDRAAVMAAAQGMTLQAQYLLAGKESQ
jgi:predicted Zn-dependent peptidase